MYMRFPVSVTIQLCIYLSVLPLIIALTKTETRKIVLHTCRHFFESGSDVYKVVWDGEPYPKYCSLRFAMRGSDTYKLCAKVTTFQLQCESRYRDEKRQLKFYYSVSTKETYYDCYSALPITYGNEDILYMELLPEYNDKQSCNLKIRITVTAKFVSKYGSSYSYFTTKTSDTGLIIGLSVGGTVFLSTIGVVVICKTVAAAARQNAGRVVIQQGNNVYVSTSTSTDQTDSRDTKSFGEQNITLVQYPGGATSNPGRYQPMPAGQYQQSGYQPMHAGRYQQTGNRPMQTGSQPGSSAQTPSPHANRYFIGEQGFYPPENQQSNETKSIASAPPPSYNDVMEKGTDLRQ